MRCLLLVRRALSSINQVICLLGEGRFRQTQERTKKSSAKKLKEMIKEKITIKGIVLVSVLNNELSKTVGHWGEGSWGARRGEGRGEKEVV